MEEKLITLIAEHLGMDPSQLGPKTSLRSDLALDSLAIMELFRTVEKALTLTLPDFAAGRIQTVGQLVELVGTCGEPGAASGSNP